MKVWFRAFQWQFALRLWGARVRLRGLHQASQVKASRAIWIWIPAEHRDRFRAQSVTRGHWHAGRRAIMRASRVLGWGVMNA
eukprot:3596801-Rhodomonas_salina.2